MKFEKIEPRILINFPWNKTLSFMRNNHVMDPGHDTMFAQEMMRNYSSLINKGQQFGLWRWIGELFTSALTSKEFDLKKMFDAVWVSTCSSNYAVSYVSDPAYQTNFKQ